MKKHYCGACITAICGLVFALTACSGDTPTQQSPEKLKDGDAISLVVGENKPLNLSEYIAIPQTGYTYEVKSSDTGVLTVTVTENTATVTGVAPGVTQVTAAAGTVNVTFDATVYGAAPTFDAKTLAYDLCDETTKTLTLAPATLADAYSYSYALKTANQNVEITGSTLTSKYSAAGSETVTVVATYTDPAHTTLPSRTAEFNVAITVTDTTPSVKRAEKNIELDMFDATGEDGAKQVAFDLASNIENAGRITNYSVKEGDTDIEVVDNTLVFNAVAAERTFNVTATYGGDKTLTYTVTVSVIDTTPYRIVNGGFEEGENGLTGWVMDGNIGSVNNHSTFWNEGLPMHNTNNCFRGDTNEGGTGTLTSSAFKIGGSGWITFRIGAGGKETHELMYVALVEVGTDGEADKIVRVWRNYKFADTGAGDIDKTGTEKFILNLVTYKADLTDFINDGKQYKLVFNDGAAGGFGFFTIDDVVTYYADENDLPTQATNGNRPVFEAENEIANKTELQNVINSYNITAQGDYTQESYNAFVKAKNDATAIINKVYAMQASVNAAKAELEAKYAALTYRVPTEERGAPKTITIAPNANKEIDITKYVKEDSLSDITYAVTSADNTKATVGDIANKKFTITAGSTETANPVNVTLTVKHKNEDVLTVTLAITVALKDPELRGEAEQARTVDVDIFEKTDKTKYAIDFASFIDNSQNKPLTYTVTQKIGEATETSIAVADNGTYDFTYAGNTFTDVATAVVYNVTVGYDKAGSAQTINFTYTLNVLDSTAYRITNGGFDNDLEGWTLSNDKLGAVNDTATYWGEGIPFRNDGKFFNAYAVGCEEKATGTLTSSTFKIGGSGYITYKLGGAINGNSVRMEIVETETNILLASYYNGTLAPEDKTNENQSLRVANGSLVTYKADLSAFIGKTVYIRFVDNAERDWGLFFTDSIVTYYKVAPTTGNDANVHYMHTLPTAALNTYQVYNGDFEKGTLEGWTVISTATSAMGKYSVSNATTYWGEELPFNKSGTYFLNGFDTGVPEPMSWAIRSSVFTLGGSRWMSVKMGGNATALKLFKKDGTQIGEYRPNHFNGVDANFPYEGDGEGKGSWAGMRTYFIDLTAIADGTELYVELHDTGPASGWANAYFDDVVTYYATKPATNGYDTVRAAVSGHPYNRQYADVQLAHRVATNSYVAPTE